MNNEERELHRRVIKQLIKNGMLLEGGFTALLISIPPDTPENQVRMMHIAYMAGAQHLFASIMAALDPDAEPTENDLRRMAQISSELDAAERSSLASRIKSGLR